MARATSQSALLTATEWRPLGASEGGVKGKHEGKCRKMGDETDIREENPPEKTGEREAVGGGERRVGWGEGGSWF